MKCEIERMEINYTFYFFAFFEKVIKKLLTFCYWQNRKIDFDITRHKRYKELADANKKNEFEVEKYLNHNLTFSKDTEFELFRINVTEYEIRQIEIIN